MGNRSGFKTEGDQFDHRKDSTKVICSDSGDDGDTLGRDGRQEVIASVEKQHLDLSIFTSHQSWKTKKVSVSEFE